MLIDMLQINIETVSCDVTENLRHNIREILLTPEFNFTERLADSVRAEIKTGSINADHWPAFLSL